MTDPDELEAIRASDPDAIGLMDVMELVAPEARVTGWHRLPGGVGAPAGHDRPWSSRSRRGALHRIDVTMPSGAQTGFVLRRYLPEIGQDGTVATREAATLEALRPTPIAAPEVLWLDADGTVFDRPALAMTVVPGRPRSAEVAEDPAVAQGLAEALVSLHWAPLERLDHLPAHPDVASLVAPLRDARDTMPRSDLVDTRRMIDAVLAHADEVDDQPATLSHGDFHVGNVRFDGGRATGIVDWDQARIADPRSDLAYCALDLALLAGTDVAEAFLGHHADLRGELTHAPWWRLRAALTALPDPLDWIPAWHALGVEVTRDQVADRFVAWVDTALAEL